MDEERTLMAQLIGEYIVSTRRDKHIRQYALAARADIPRGRCARWKRARLIFLFIS